METTKMTRRDFGKSAALGAVSLAMTAGPAVHNILGANDRIGLGLIGAGGIGKFGLENFMRTEQVDVVAIADVYEVNLNEAVALTRQKAKGYKDFRKLLEHKDIDAVLIATPDHWHAPIMIAACEAGKDVYEEKPLSHTVFEGRRMVEAAARNKRVVQVGTQQRSGEHFQKAVELVRSGKLGKVTLVETWIYNNQWPEGIGNPPDSAVPTGLDWDFWQGPAPVHPYNENRCLNTFRWFWDYSGGMLTDWGTHLLDIVQWGMDVTAPTTVFATGGKYVMQDNRETPDTLEVVYQYPASPVSGKEFLVRFSNRVANNHTADGHGYGIQFYGTEGSLFVDRSGYTFWPEAKRVGSETIASSAAIKSDGSPQYAPHVLNFLDCIRSRQKPVSHIETMHRATSACLIGNISFHLGRKLRWDAQREKFVNDPEADKLLTKEYRRPWVVS